MNMIPIQRIRAGLRGALLLAALGCGASLVLPARQAHAALPDYQCQGSGVQNVALTVDLLDQGQAGATKTQAFNLGSNAPGTCSCPVDGSRYSWFTATTTYPVDANNWITLNDYLAAQVSINIYGGGNPLVPFSQVRNGSATPCGPSYSNAYSISTGSRGSVTFKLLKGVLGTQRFSGTVATMYWQMVNTSQPDPAYPFVKVAFDITLKANASCSFRAGDSITVDLGTLSRDELSAGGPPKSGAGIKTVDLSLDCVNTGAASAVNYMFQGTKTSVGNPFVQSTLPGLGIGMKDPQGNPILLGDSIDVPLSNGSTNFPVQVYPTQIPGETLEAGNYSAYYIVTVSLP
jgi:hypothetical protein